MFISWNESYNPKITNASVRSIMKMIHYAHRAISYSVDVGVTHPLPRHSRCEHLVQRYMIGSRRISLECLDGLEQKFCNDARVTAATFNPWPRCCNEPWWNSLRCALCDKRVHVRRNAIRDSLVYIPGYFFLSSTFNDVYLYVNVCFVSARHFSRSVLSCSFDPIASFISTYSPSITFSRVANSSCAFPTACLPKIVARNPIPRAVVPVIVIAHARHASFSSLA